MKRRNATEARRALRDEVSGQAIGGNLKPSPPDRGRVLKMDLNGRILVEWSRFGNYDGQIDWGHDIAAGKDGAVYIGDVNRSMRVQKIVSR